MSRPSLQRQTTQSDPDPARNWLSDVYFDAHLAWDNAQKCFPEFFRGDIGFFVLHVTEELLQDIERHTGERPNLEHYRKNEYVGVARRHMIFGTPVHAGDKLFTMTSYDGGAIAMYEICIMAIESIRTIVRHLLYTTDILNTSVPYNCEEIVSFIITTGSIPTVPDNFDNDHARESSPRPVR